MDKQLLDMELEQINEIYQLITEFIITYSFQILGGILIVILGWFVAGKVKQAILNVCQRRAIDITLASFLASSIKVLILTVFIIIALGKIGISIAPFVAALGAASLGIGLAVQGPLSNYGAGITIILTRPFVIGDTITIKNVNGIVKIIKLAYTILEDEDGVEFTIPNKHIVGEIIANSHADSLIEILVDIAYSEDAEKACELLQKEVNQLPLRSQKREAVVGIEAFAESGITLGIRFWAPTDKLFEAKYAANKIVYSVLRQNHIDIPFPQREIKILSQ